MENCVSMRENSIIMNESLGNANIKYERKVYISHKCC